LSHSAAPSIWLALPFAGLLLSIALGPILARRIWHVHYGKAAAIWAALALVSLLVTQGLTPTVTSLAHTLLADYLPFILMLFALYTTAGGIVVSDLAPATPRVNTLLLATGTLAASLVGTTGAAMILIRPVLQANAARQHKVHVVIFFIFLVANIGGALSPLGDPPLFFGFLRGVDFFWPARHLWPQFALVAGLLLAIFFALDTYFFAKEPKIAPVQTWLEVRGLKNVALIAGAVAVIIGSAIWRSGINFEILGTHFALQDLVRSIALLAIGVVSIALTPRADHEANHFSWEPFEEVAKLFAAIFVCIIPVMAMLAAKTQGPFAPVIAFLSHPNGAPHDAAYFWATGLLSSLLDNAPTYLVFFGLAGGDAIVLSGELARTLAAISLGAVFMGALTYIGNAPNFMVYALARRARVPMPSFFGYLVWAGAILVPIFVLVTLIFFV
jgi:Na+/H+ antiporter NhaD/arsenite permease-like protein